MLPNTDFSVKEWRAAGLNVPSGVKAQVSTVEERLVVKTVGTLTARHRGVQLTADDRTRPLTWMNSYARRTGHLQRGTGEGTGGVSRAMSETDHLTDD